jgi:hypothetical protein
MPTALGPGSSADPYGRPKLDGTKPYGFVSLYVRRYASMYAHIDACTYRRMTQSDLAVRHRERLAAMASYFSVVAPSQNTFWFCPVSVDCETRDTGPAVLSSA